MIYQRNMHIYATQKLEQNRRRQIFIRVTSCKMEFLCKHYNETYYKRRAKRKIKRKRKMTHDISCKALHITFYILHFNEHND